MVEEKGKYREHSRDNGGPEVELGCQNGDQRDPHPHTSGTLTQVKPANAFYSPDSKGLAATQPGGRPSVLKIAIDGEKLIFLCKLCCLIQLFNDFSNF